MMRRTIISHGTKFIVNTPILEDDKEIENDISESLARKVGLTEDTPVLPPPLHFHTLHGG